MWKQHQDKKVEEVNWHKFCHPVEESNLKELLLETGEWELVEVRGYHMINRHEV